MDTVNRLSRRAFLAAAAASAALGAKKKIPVGLELYSVRNELKKDLFATVKAVAKMGYDGVEFYSPYFEWTPAYAKDVRKLMDDSGIRCLSTHNSLAAISPEKISKAIELNQIIGSKFVIAASAGKPDSLDAWKRVAEQLASGAEKLRPAGMRTGFHNHQLEFTPVGGVRPVEVLAKNTPKDVVLQLDIGTCMDAGSDPVKWILDNPGRIASMHCKDWARDPGKGFEVLFGEGAAPWKKIFAAAEKTGGLEYYLVEQEGSRYSELETAERCLTAFRRARA